MNSELHAVTGAFGYSGRYIAQRLLEGGRQVRTLTNSPYKEDPFEGRVMAYPLRFEDPGELERSLQGVSVLYNTYWVRFNHKSFTHAQAVTNTRVLFKAALNAGVKRIVHVSITNPSLDSPLEYFSGKAELEGALRESGLSHAILRPTVLFGREDILINNIAWLLRHSPVFGIFGDGQYRLQPIFVDDLAALAVREGEGSENVTIDAIGPETFTYRDLVRTVGRLIGCDRRLISLPPWLGYYAGVVLGTIVGDVLITRDEIRGLMDGLLHVESPPTGQTKLTHWIMEHRLHLGARYASELGRRTRPAARAT